jgi:alpha-glucosidase
MLLPIVAAAMLGSSCARGGAPVVTVTSPDGNNAIVLRDTEAGSGRRLAYSVKRRGQRIIEPSTLDIVLAGAGQVAREAEIVGVRKDRLDETFEMPWGKSRIVRNNFCRAIVRLESRAGIVWSLELRAYNDGVAFRYGFPEQAALGAVVLESESTEFRLAGNPTLLMTSTDSFAWPHERLHARTPLSLVPEKASIEMPVLVVWPGGTSAALTEAALRDFGGMYLRRAPETGSPVLQAVLSPRLDRPGVAVSGPAPLTSPWRVIWLADEAGAQIASNLLVCLNDSPSPDYQWPRPGKTTWHWWNGTAEEGLPKTSGMRFEYHREYIDFCARHGIAYHAVVSDDRPWYVQTQKDFAPGPDTDILMPRPELELPKIIAYAKEKGVGIRLWVHWKPLAERLEEAFAAYESWGISGLMVDFLDRDDQDMVRFCERVLESASRHGLHIQFHGSYKPSGEHRTFPNLFNREGSLNLEYLKWSAKCTPGHNVDAAFTRALAGPHDYHLGGFRSVSKSAFRPRHVRPAVLGTRCHHLALYIIYENPMPQLCDTPEAYEGQPGLEFLEEVPVTWDETRFLAGQVGEYMVVARRSGAAWYLGGITNEYPRRISIPLGVLGQEGHDVRLFADGSMNEEEPNAVRIESRAVAAGAPLEVDLAPGGGFVAVVRAK